MRAPGSLEAVRVLLNTWEIPKATGAPVDHLPRLVASRDAWSETFPGAPWNPKASRPLAALRDQLRGMVEARGLDDVWLEQLLSRVLVRPAVNADAGGSIRHPFRPWVIGA